MLLFYALEARSPWSVLAFAGALAAILAAVLIPRHEPEVGAVVG
jgi:hypothetical protein